MNWYHLIGQEYLIERRDSIDLNDKLEMFRDFCGDWDYRNIDMTLPHLQSIDIVGDTISVEIEMYSTILDDYVSVDGGDFTDINLVNKFNNLNLDCREDVWEFMEDVENLVDWKKMEKELSLEVKKNLRLEKIQEMSANLITKRKDRCR